MWIVRLPLRSCPKMTIALVAVVGCQVAALPAAGQTRAWFDEARRRMVDESIVAAGVRHPQVIQAMLSTPRHEFVARELRQQAYFDMSLPIGAQQTISSPFIVAFMTEALDPQPTDRVLEIGTGSGYQAAVLSPLVAEVYTIEIVDSLGRQAARTLERLGYDNVQVKVGDGYLGWPEHAPFDKIIVTCSPESVPQPLADQLREGGLMIIPVGERYQQTLYLMRKRDGELEAERLQPTLFVPMTGAAEEAREVQPDPANPQVLNGGFEEPLQENGYLSGWYYQRQLTWENDPGAPQGQHYVTLYNQHAGRAAHVMQGFPIDGRQVLRLEFSAWVKHENTRRGPTREALPVAAVSFYDETRREIGMALLGPFFGDSPWRHVSRQVRVPPQAREGIVRLGLFGATGTISFDDVTITGSAF
jgi:protein-L-isoaspartate(D-aspartate) O-methyltransferase